MLTRNSLLDSTGNQQILDAMEVARNLGERYLRCDQAPDFLIVLPSTPYKSRGWTFQERPLSKGCVFPLKRVLVLGATKTWFTPMMLGELKVLPKRWLWQTEIHTSVIHNFPSVHHPRSYAQLQEFGPDLFQQKLLISYGYSQCSFRHNA